MDHFEKTIVLPSKPRIVSEDGNKGVYEIDNLYPGYGYTIGNSLRRIILSSLPGAAVTSIKIDGVEHEFSTIDGIKEDVLVMLLNIKKIRFNVTGDEAVTVTLHKKGEGEVLAQDIETPGQVEVLDKDIHIATITNKNTELKIEMVIEKGLGFVAKDALSKSRVDIGTIALDANFTPVRRANYEVENMRVGDRTDFNRLRISLETDGSITPKEALESSIRIMIEQLRAITGFEDSSFDEPEITTGESKDEGIDDQKLDPEFLKTRIESLELSARTMNALSGANIRTVGGLARKKEDDILEIEGLGAKGVAEIKRVLSDHGITLK